MDEDNIIKSKKIKDLVDSDFWNPETTEVHVAKDSNLIHCPNCKSSSTRRIQNALTFIKNAPFYQGSEWLGYCYDCGTLYEYYTNRIINIPSQHQRVNYSLVQ